MIYLELQYRLKISPVNSSEHRSLGQTSCKWQIIQNNHNQSVCELTKEFAEAYEKSIKMPRTDQKISIIYKVHEIFTAYVTVHSFRGSNNSFHGTIVLINFNIPNRPNSHILQLSARDRTFIMGGHSFIWRRGSTLQQLLTVTNGSALWYLSWRDSEDHMKHQELNPARQLVQDRHLTAILSVVNMETLSNYFLFIYLVLHSFL